MKRKASIEKKEIALHHGDILMKDLRRYHQGNRSFYFCIFVRTDSLPPDKVPVNKYKIIVNFCVLGHYKICFHIFQVDKVISAKGGYHRYNKLKNRHLNDYLKNDKFSSNIFLLSLL